MKKEMAIRSSILPGKFQGQRNLAGYCPWGHKESDMTEQTQAHNHPHTHYGEVIILLLRADDLGEVSSSELSLSSLCQSADRLRLW